MITASFKDVAGVWKRYIFLVGLEDENGRLKRDNALLLQEINRYREGYLEGIRLQKLLALKESSNHHTTAAMVIGRDQTSIMKTILINKGTSHGLRLDLPVIADQGVVGRIVETSAHVSRVLLLIDENSNTDALIQENRIQGILQGCSFPRMFSEIRPENGNCKCWKYSRHFRPLRSLSQRVAAWRREERGEDG